MFIKAIPSGPFETNAYIIASTKTHTAIIIDPSPDSSSEICRILELESLKPEKIVLTHSHWDHIADVAFLKNKFQIPVFIHREDVKNLENPGSDGLPLWIPIQGVVPDEYLNDGDSINMGEITFKVIHTPGHTPGGICLYNQENNLVITGDTLFKGTIGNLSFPTARPKLMWKSLEKLAKLPPNTTIYPGHGEKSTIGEESWLSRAEEIFGND